VWSLGEIEGACARIVELSPLDGSELPSAQAYPWVVGDVPCGEREFQGFLATYLGEERARWIEARRPRKGG